MPEESELSFYLYSPFTHSDVSAFDQQVLKAGGIGRLELHLFARDGVVEAELEGVQRQTAEGIEVLEAIASVADDGMAEVLHVDTDLVLAAGFEVELHERIAVGTLDGAVVGDGFLAAVVRGAGVDVEGAVGEPGVDNALVFLHLAGHNGHVAAVEDNLVPVVAQGVLRLLVLGKHHQTGRVAVEAVDHVDTVVAARTLEVLIENGAGGAFLLALGADREQALHLFDHDEVGILVDNLQQLVVELVVALGAADLYLHAGLQGEVVLGGDDIVDKHDALAEQCLELGAAGLRHAGSQKLHQFHRFADEIVRVLGAGSCGSLFLCHERIGVKRLSGMRVVLSVRAGRRSPHGGCGGTCRQAGQP